MLRQAGEKAAACDTEDWVSYNVSHLRHGLMGFSATHNQM